MALLFRKLSSVSKIHKTFQNVANQTIQDIEPCLCSYIKPIWKLSQIIGIAPSNFEHTETQIIHIVPRDQFISVISPAMNNKQREMNRIYRQCTLSIKWISIPSVINIILTVFYMTMSLWVFLNFKTVLKVYFEGTDLYTFVLQAQGLYMQACVTLANALFKRKKLQEIWGSLHHVYKLPNKLSYPEIDKETRQRLRKLKWISYFMVICTILSAVLYAVYFLNLVFHNCFPNSKESFPKIGEEESGLPPCPLQNIFMVMQKISYTLLVFYNTGTASLFSAFCALLCILHKRINTELEKVFEETWVNGHKLENRLILGNTKAVEIEKLRISHETLCKVARLMGDYFGLSILIVSVCAVLSITCAFYTAVLRLGIVGSKAVLVVAGHYVLSAFHGIFAVLVLGLILTSGQMVTNVAEKPAQIIGEVSHLQMNAEERHQVSIFLQKLCPTSRGIRACNVTNIGMSFLAAAATNVVTYILVILQFRLGVEDHRVHLSNNTDSP